MCINKEKCDAWCDMLFAIIKMSRELSDDEFEYIKANFSIAFGHLKLKELEKKGKKNNE